jgi:Family of unknown function (DUF6401)
MYCPGPDRFVPSNVMSSEHNDPIAALRLAAQWALADWMRRLGAVGMDAMRAVPGLVAQVDQHAAQVRDALVDRHGEIPLAGLAAYADGVADIATARGWSAAEVVDGDWAGASWPTVRLLSICVLAKVAEA